jgi:plasmid maintenance system antidote protein VapI
MRDSPGRNRDVPHRRRPPLSPLRPDLPGPVTTFVERFREVYQERLTLNQRELAAALHTTKSPMSRYLNGEKIIPADTLDMFCTLARLTPQERDELRTLRDHAETAHAGGTPVTDPAEHPAEGRQPRYRRAVLLWALPAIALLAAGSVLLALVNSGSQDDRNSGTTPSSSPGCQPARQYTVTADGDVLDEHHHDIADVHRGDTFTRDTPPTNPYQSRYYGHIPQRNITGYVDQAKLKYVGDVCS